MFFVLVIGFCGGVSVVAGFVLLCYKLCFKKRSPSWQTDTPAPCTIIPSPTIPLLPIKPHHVQPPTPEPVPCTPPTPTELPPPTPPPLYVLPPDPPRNLQKILDDSEIARRFAQGKIAQLEMEILFRSNVLEMKIRKIDKIHSSVNKEQAYVRLKSPREKRISVHMMEYNKRFQALLGSQYFRFNLSPAKLQESVFRFYLWSVDQQSRQKEFGEFALDFAEVTAEHDLRAGYLDVFDFMVYDTTPQEKDPCIRLRLKYHCKTSKVIVSILEIRDLIEPSSPLPGGTYVKVIFSQGGRQRPYKTKLVKGRSPQFHTTFNHEVRLRELSDTVLHVHIKTRTIHTETLSVLEFSSHATGRLAEHWTQMLQEIDRGYGVEMTHRISQEKRRPGNFTRRMTTTTLF